MSIFVTIPAALLDGAFFLPVKAGIHFKICDSQHRRCCSWATGSVFT